jgi:hypothetical protein
LKRVVGTQIQWRLILLQASNFIIYFI